MIDTLNWRDQLPAKYQRWRERLVIFWLTGANLILTQMGRTLWIAFHRWYSIYVFVEFWLKITFYVLDRLVWRSEYCFIWKIWKWVDFNWFACESTHEKLNFFLSFCGGLCWRQKAYPLADAVSRQLTTDVECYLKNHSPSLVFLCLYRNWSSPQIYIIHYSSNHSSFMVLFWMNETNFENVVEIEHASLLYV